MDVCDFHSHILPGVDHGSYSVEESMAQLALARKSGIMRIVATSHFYPHKESVDKFIKRRDEAYTLLKERYGDDIPDIRLAAEVLLCAGFDEIPMLDDLCIRGTKTILIELPFNDFGKEYVGSVRGLIERGYRVILAHAERYDLKHIEKMIEIGALLQVNVQSMTSAFTKKIFASWLERRKIVAIGSDIHGADKRAYKKFKRACKRLGAYAEEIKRVSDSIWESSVAL